MVSLDTVQADSAKPIIINEPTSSPRISFSAEFLDDSFITISPNNPRPAATSAGDFEFLSGANSLSSGGAMIGADELFFEGKLLPFWHSHHAQKLSKINLNDDNATTKPSQNDDVPDKEIKPAMDAEENKAVIGTSSGGGTTSWFMDDDPSPRPPKCTVLWKELLRLKKQRSASGLSPSSSTSSSSSSNSVLDSAAESRHAKHHSSKGSSAAAAARRGLERTRSATIRIRPMINVPICTQVKTSVVATSHYALPPLFPLKKGKLER